MSANRGPKRKAVLPQCSWKLAWAWTDDEPTTEEPRLGLIIPLPTGETSFVLHTNLVLDGKAIGTVVIPWPGR